VGYEIGDVLLSEETIRARVRELGQSIAQDYRGRELIVVGVLKGAVVFLSDLVRAVPYQDVRVKLDFIAVSSYGASTRSSGIVKIQKDLDTDLEGREVLLVEDIVDSGLTLSYLARLLENRGPKSLRLCSLLDKPERRQAEVRIDYRGFSIPDEFVVGYGLDYAGLWRNLPEIRTVRVTI
jgi:hypoxanthine phosphoribosyltransferase